MRTYELVVMLKGSLSPEKRKKTTDGIKALLKDTKVTKEDVWGEKALMYPIKHEKSGYYMIWNIETEVLPADLEKKLYAHDDIIRHLLTKTKPQKMKKGAKEEKKVETKVEKEAEVAIEKPKKVRKKKTE